MAGINGYGFQYNAYPQYNFKGVQQNNTQQPANIYSKPPKYLTQQQIAKDDSHNYLKVGGALLGLAVLALGIAKGKNLLKNPNLKNIKNEAQTAANEAAHNRNTTITVNTTTTANTTNIAHQTPTPAQTVKAETQAVTPKAEEAVEKAANETKPLQETVENKAVQETVEDATAKEAEAKAAKEAEAKAAKEAAAKAAENKRRYDIVLKNIGESKVINKKVDEIMSRPDFEQKFSELMQTNIQIPKGKYDCTMVETTLDDVLNSTIKGEYKKPVDTLYHGTNSYSYNDIMKNGFSKDAVNIAESGKGIYFGTSKAGAENYSLGGVISAKYTGRKVADVEPGVVDNLGSKLSVRTLFANKLGLNSWDEEASLIIDELINRAYTKKLNAMGYDALHSNSIGAGCDYIVVLDPKDIQILK